MGLALNYSQKVAIANPHIRGNKPWRFPLRIAGSHFFHFISRHTTLSCSERNPAPPSAFGVHVSDIISLCAKKQMFRINAKRCVAAMQYPHALRYRSVVDNVREAVGENRYLRCYVERPVPSSLFARLSSEPKPAFRRVLYVSGKSLAEGQVKPVHIIHRALIGAVFVTRAAPAYVRAAELASGCYAKTSQGVNLQSGFVTVRLADC